MKRGLLTLLLVVVLGCAAAFAGLWWNSRLEPADWMGRKLGLTGPALEEFTAAHDRYEALCIEMCRRIDASNREVAGLIESNNAVTPELREALGRAANVREECRAAMLSHFYGVSFMLPDAQRQRYLEMVLPLIFESEMLPASEGGHSHSG